MHVRENKLSKENEDGCKESKIYINLGIIKVDGSI